MKHVHETDRHIPVVREVDVAVAGGGPAGIAAAVSAARNGMDVLLIERNSFLGGVATAVLMAVFIIPLEKLSGFSKELMQRISDRGGAWTGRLISFDPETFKQVSLETVEESGAELLLYANVVEPILENGSIRGLVIESKSGRQAILAKRVIDASGDADIAIRAGVEHVKGRELDGKMRPMTVLFRIGGLDVTEVVDYARSHPEQFTADPNMQVTDLEAGVVRLSGFFDLVTEARERGELDRDCHYLRLEGVQIDRGIAFVNSTRVYGVDGTDVFDITRAEIEARKQVKQLIRFINDHVPGGRGAYIIDTSTNIGVRETNRIRGAYVLTEKDIANKTNYEDAIVTLRRRHVPGQPMHSPDAGEGSSSDGPSRSIILPLTAFQVPYRVLLPKNVDNLLVAGRCISVTHEADAFTRGMFCCMAFGQGAGTAAALSVKSDVSLNEINSAELQRALKDQGVLIDRVDSREE
jgi:glycine/D-amino acid oxidase-like deaminating enzyme